MPSRISQMRNVPLQQPQNQQPQYQINEEYLQQLKALMHSKNAPQYIMEIAAMNPQFKNIVDIGQSGNLKAIFESMARQYNVDPNWLLRKLLD